MRIEWIEEWITIFQVTDVEWNSKTGKITVWPGSVTEPENPEEPVEPEPVPEEDETPEEKELREFLEELENLSNGVQVNALTEEQQVSLEEYKVIVDAIIVKFKAKNFSDARISAAITAVQNVKDIISTGTSTKKELYVEVLDYLIGGLQELLNIEISQFKSLLLLNDSETQELQNIIAFNIEWEYQEVWVIFKDENGSYIRQTIEKDIDGYYIVQADTNLCTECISEFQPYIINNVWNYIYPNGLWNYLSFSDENKFRNIAIVENNGNIWVASDEEIIEIAGVSYWKNLWLATQDVWVFLFLNLVWVWWGAVDFKISSYMLSKFMYWDGSDDYYNTNHWISEEVKNASWYDDKKEEALLKKSEYLDGSIWEVIDIDKSSNYEDTEMYKIKDVDNFNRDMDFKLAFWKVNWQSEVVHYQDGFYLKINIYDEYDFNPSYHQNSWFEWVLKDVLNAWGTHYEERGYWKPYNWEIEILEKIY